jgi:heme A synthase
VILIALGWSALAAILGFYWARGELAPRVRAVLLPLALIAATLAFLFGVLAYASSPTNPLRQAETQMAAP